MHTGILPLEAIEGSTQFQEQSVAFTQTAAADPAEITVGAPVMFLKEGMSRLTAEISIDGKSRELWFEVDPAYAGYLATDTLDAFVAASLVPAIVRGQNIRVNGPMSSRLYYSFSNYLIPILSDYLEKPRTIRIIADRLLTAYKTRGNGVAAGFSGGIDSFCNFYDHSGDRVPEEFRLTHFLFNNVGAHGQKAAEADRKLFQKRFNRLQDAARKIGRPAVAVDSNLDEFFGDKFQLTHTLRNTVVALTMQHAFCKFMYSSGYPLSETKVKPDYNMSRLDPVILPLLSTERLECIASGGQHTRVEKTRRVAEIRESRSYLDVCVTPDNAPEGFSNCGICWKCIRTATTLKIYGRLKEYDRAISLDNFGIFENLYLIEVMGGNSSFAGEIRDLIKEKNYRVPLSVRIIAALLPAPVAQQFSIRIIPALVSCKPLGRFINGCLSW